MGEIVNLRQVKKQRARREAEQAAQTNRTSHGRTPAQKANDAREKARRQALLDGKQHEPDGR